MSAVIIPSIGCSPRLIAVLEAANASHADEVIVIENQSYDNPRHVPRAAQVIDDRECTYVCVPEMSLYQTWNYGIVHVNEFHPSDRQFAVILNDDVEITSGAINLLIEALVQNPDYAVIGANYKTRFLDPEPTYPIVQVGGTYRHGGIGGFAFACRADVCQVDEQFEWWGGDDDLVKQAMAGGWKIGVHTGAPVLHPEPETSARHFIELIEAKDRDRARMLAKWGETW